LTAGRTIRLTFAALVAVLSISDQTGWRLPVAASMTTIGWSRSA
jgi:hypothetical protein